MTGHAGHMSLSTSQGASELDLLIVSVALSVCVVCLLIIVALVASSGGPDDA